MAIQVGDWVRSYSKGIWQVTRVVPEHYEIRYSLSEPLQLDDRPHFLLKRLVNEKWKPAFAAESAEASFVKPLTKADAGKLERFLKDNAGVVTQFESFRQPLDWILNLGFSLAKRSDFRRFKAEFQEAFAEPLRGGMSSDAVLKVIAQSSYADRLGEMPQSATLQFVCQDHEVKRRHVIFRQLNIHNF
jgi:hypothetical protein